MTLAQQIARVRAELDVDKAARRRRLPPRSPRRLELESLLRGLVIRQLRTEIRHDRRGRR